MTRHTLRKLSYAVSVLSLMTVLTGTPRTARAGGSLSWFGNDSRSAAMGGTGASGGVGPGNLLLNPALMSFVRGGAWISFSMAPSWLNIDLKNRSDDYDVPDTIYQSHPGMWEVDHPVPTSMMSRARSDTRGTDTSYLLSVVAIDSFFHEDLKLGIGFTTPVPGMVSIETWYNDEREQHFSNKLHFERFGEFDNTMSFYPGISFAPLEWMSIGFTLQVDLAFVLKSRLFLTEGTEWEYMYLNTGGEVVPIFRPIAGAAFRTPFDLGFGIVYRHHSYTNVDVDIDMRVWNGEQLDDETDELQLQFQQSHRNVFGYKPKELVLAASYSYRGFSVEVDGTWEMWSGYLDRHGNHWNHPSWDDTDDITADGWDSDWKDPTFDDVVSVRVGAEVWVTDRAALRAGMGYFPSPMPIQTGRYSYVDNDLLMYSLGAGFRFQVLGRTVTTDLAAQLWHMRSLTVMKNNVIKEDGGVIDEVPDDLTDFDGNVMPEAAGLQTNNPGFPGYTFGGLVLNLSLMIGMEFN